MFWLSEIMWQLGQQGALQWCCLKFDVHVVYKASITRFVKHETSPVSFSASRSEVCCTVNAKVWPLKSTSFMLSSRIPYLCSTLFLLFTFLHFCKIPCETCWWLKCPLLVFAATLWSSAVISRSCLPCLCAVVRRQEEGCTTPVAKGTTVCKVLFWRRGGQWAVCIFLKLLPARTHFT